MRVCIKIGTQTILNPSGVVAHEILQELFATIGLLKKAHHEVLVVISGAVASGKVSSVLQTRQGQASRGQWLLAENIISANQQARLPMSLLLLSRQDIVNRQRYITLQDTFDDLLASGITPIINENDATTIKNKNDFPDNDHLAAILAITVACDELFLLTNVIGVCGMNPDLCDDAELLPEIENVTTPLLKRLGDGKSVLGRGGIVGKLKAARLATTAGIPTIIMDGRRPRCIADVLAGTPHGTFCKPRVSKGRITNRERWMLAAKNSEGWIQVDSGAEKALRDRKSLLAVGVKKIFGEFRSNETVEVISMNKELLGICQPAIASEDLLALIEHSEKPFDRVVAHASNVILMS